MYKGIITAVILMGIGYTAGCYSVLALPRAMADQPMTVTGMTENGEFNKLVMRLNQLPVKDKR